MIIRRSQAKCDTQMRKELFMRIRWAIIGLIGLALGCSHTNKTTEAGTRASPGSSEPEEQNEVKMTLDQVPPAVRETLTRESGGAKIGRVDKEMQDGKTVYETDVMS